MPPEEPTAENPPNGAVLDYFLKSPARSVKLEIFDAQQQLVRSFDSEHKGAPKTLALPVAERWIPKPQLLETTAGMHRFVWDLTWNSSGGPDADEEADYRNPRGPKAVPGTYQVRLTVDGQTQAQSLQVKMDPRAAATPDVLAEQFQLGRKIFGETLEARRAIAQITQVQKALSEALGKTQDPNLKKTLTDAQTEIGAILSSKTGNNEAQGLQEAYSDLASALRVVESGDRAIPSQAIELSKQSSAHVKMRIQQWAAFKQARLPKLNQELKQANLAPIAAAEIEREVELLMTQ